METKHTPGPWVVQKHDDQPYIVADQSKKWDNPTICNLYEDVTPEDSVTIGQWLKAHENAWANARLIAAAPDLLAALKALLKAELYAGDEGVYSIANTGMKGSEDAVKAARAAIKKATGQA